MTSFTPTVASNLSDYCFSGCPLFSESLFDGGFNDLACAYMLQNVFTDCTSFSIGRGECVVPPCAATCSSGAWCSFAAHSAVACFKDPPAEALISLTNACLTPHFIGVSDGSDASGTGSGHLSQSSLFGFLVAMTIFCVWELLQFFVGGKFSFVFLALSGLSILFTRTRRRGLFGGDGHRHILLGDLSTHMSESVDPSVCLENSEKGMITPSGSFSSTLPLTSAHVRNKIPTHADVEGIELNILPP